MTYASKARRKMNSVAVPRIGSVTHTGLQDGALVFAIGAGNRYIERQATSGVFIAFDVNGVQLFEPDPPKYLYSSLDRQASKHWLKATVIGGTATYMERTPAGSLGTSIRMNQVIKFAHNLPGLGTSGNTLLRFDITLGQMGPIVHSFTAQMNMAYFGG